MIIIYAIIGQLVCMQPTLSQNMNINDQNMDNASNTNSIANKSNLNLERMSDIDGMHHKYPVHTHNHFVNKLFFLLFIMITQ